jgi:hypothetical protein
VWPRFREAAAITYDIRTMSFKGINQVSLLVLGGRIVVPMIVTSHQAERLGYPKGQCDLVRRKDGKWYLLVTVDVPDSSPIDPADFIGIDLGIANIATDSDGHRHSGRDVEWVRRKHNLQRKRLQRKGTKGAKKKIRRMRDKEARFRRHGESRHLQANRRVRQAHRSRNRPRGPRRHPRAGHGSGRRRSQPALGLGLRATRELHRLQGETGGNRGGLC